MTTMEEKFDRLAEEREAHRQSCEKNDDNSLKVIASEMYSNPTRFVYEIIQNAEDAGAKKINFQLDDDAMRIVHNGRDFNFEDVDSITRVGSSDKDGIHTIGKFGVGFKSVFAVSDCPAIHSGDFHFKIENYIVPSRISREFSNGTTITLPLKQDESGELREKIAKQLRGLGADAILFLSNIKRLEWRDGEKSGYCAREIKPLCERDGLHCNEVTLHANADESSEKYLLFRRIIAVDGKRVRVECAYLLNESCEIVPTVSDTPLAVYYPTEVKPRLNFRLQIPYRTPAHRESVDFTLAENRQLTEAAAALAADSLPMLRDNKLLSTNFIANVLPLKEYEKHELYRAAFCAIKNKFLSGEKLLPSIGSGFAAAKDAILGNGNLRELLDSSQITQLFGRGEWLDSPAINSATAYLQKHLGIRKVNYCDFAKQLDEKFLQSQSDEWMASFYGQLANEWNVRRWRGSALRTVEKILQSKPFIRLESGEHAALSSKDVYLPTENKTAFKTVKSCFLNDKKAAQFFRETLKLEKPGKIDEVKEFIVPRYRNGAEISKDQHIADMQKILLAEKENLGDISKELRDCSIIKTQDGSYRKISECYFANETLKCWFAGNDAMGFVDTALYDFALPPEWNETFGNLGISREIGIINKKMYESHSDGRHEIGVGNFNPGFSIEGLEFALRNITPKRSHLAWDFALEYRHQLEGKIRTSTNRTHLHNAEPKHRISKAGELFRERDWLYGKDGRLIERKNHGEITLEELPPDYRRDNEDNARSLAKFLGLKPDIIQQALEENPDLMVMSKDEVNEKDRKIEEADIRIKKLEQENAVLRHASESKKAKEANWRPAVDANKPKIKEARPPAPPSFKAGENANENADGEKAESQSGKDKNDDSNALSSEDRKQIGKWAEQYALRHLKEKYPEKDGYAVILENENSRQNPGYDIRVMRGGKTVLYAEVKGKTESAPTYADVSDAQWQAAKKHGDKYLIIVVSDAGNINAKYYPIENPAQKFRDSELIASPVRIRI